jgi:hypothetical protein
MTIKELNNNDLEKHLKSLVDKNRLVEAEILLALTEVKKRNISQQQGFANLTAYCEIRLGLSKDQAWKRSQATRTIEIASKCLELLKKG